MASNQAMIQAIAQAVAEVTKAAILAVRKTERSSKHMSNTTNAKNEWANTRAKFA